MTYAAGVDDGVNTLNGNGVQPTHDHVAARGGEACIRGGCERRGGAKLGKHHCFVRVLFGVGAAERADGVKESEGVGLLRQASGTAVPPRGREPTKGEEEERRGRGRGRGNRDGEILESGGTGTRDVI